MTQAHTSTEQPEALLIAAWLRKSNEEAMAWRLDGASAIERLQALVQELEEKVETGKRLLREEMARANRYAEASQARVPLALYQRDTIKANAWRETRDGGYWDTNAIIDGTEAAHGITQEKQG